MPSVSSPFDWFLRALHRRQVAQRLLERTGLGLLGGSGCALLLTPLLLLRQSLPGVPITPGAVAAGALAAGAGLGLLWGVVRRPTLLGAAMEADRQLGLKDLLGTAVFCRPGGGTPGAALPDAWCGVVLAVADGHCRELEPGSVLFRRLGARAWGGIGLSAAAALAVALLAGSAPDSQAAGPRAEEPGVPSPAGVTPAGPAERPLLSMVPGPPAAATEHDDPDAGTSAGRPPGTRPPDAGEASPGTGDGASPHRPGTGAPGTRSGSSQTRPPTRGPGPPVAPDAGPGGERPRSSDAAAERATLPGGAGRGGDDRSPADGSPGGASGTGTAAPRNPHTTPPWQTNAWPADVRRAREALDGGQVPPAYQEMVRRYFERP